jgi:hypothetical protein
MKSFQRLVLPAVTAIAALCIYPTVNAQQVYRCGNSYSQTPCDGAIAVNTDDPRTEAQRAEAKAGLSSDKALAKDLEATRRKDEAMALAQQKAVQASNDKKTAAGKLADKKESKKKEQKAGGIRTVKVKNAAPEFFTATDGATTKKKKAASKSAAP